MIYRKVDLYREWGIPREGRSGGYLAVYAPERDNELREKRRPAALVIPGGAYLFLSEREGEPVCLALLAAGYAAFRLDYTVKAAYPTPLIEAAMAAAYLRKHAAEYFVDPAHVAAVGFSAGGHLAGMLATMFSDPHIERCLKDDAALVRPDAAVLSYPVVTGDPALTHADTFATVTGGDPALREALSLERNVTEGSVPAFLWHTGEDGAVPAENTLLLASAYRRAGVPFELHLFERGTHGLSLANEETSEGEGTPLYEKNAQSWLPLALRWLRSRGFCVRAKE